MDGQILMQTALLVRSLIDAAKAVIGLVPAKQKRDEIPVYRLVTGDQLLASRAKLETDITPWRWPR